MDRKDRLTSKSPLTKACYDHKLDTVLELIAEGAPVDASDQSVWHGEAQGCLDGAPYYTPLGEACRSDIGPVDRQVQVVKALLEAGAPVNQRDYVSATPLHHAASRGRAPVIKLILDAGAELNAVSSMGNAVQALIGRGGPDAPGGEKVESLKMLLVAGVDPRAAESHTHDLLKAVGDLSDLLTSRSRNDKSRGRACLELMRIVGEYGPDWPELDAWLERAEAAALQGDAKARKAKEKLDALRAGLNEADFEKKVKRAIGKTPAGRRDALVSLCRYVLSAPEVVAHEIWPALVGHLLELTVDYGDITEDTYGRRLTLDDMEDDEGGALDYYADEELCTADLCLKLCAGPEALKRTDIADLIRRICETKHARIGYMSFGDDEAEALIATLRKNAHPEAEALSAVARRCFPFARF